jgi:tetratricopeptide (TPR) repeat protein
MLLGRVNTVRGNFDVAKSEYASSVYYAACCYGAEAIPTSIGYFRLGDVFLGRGNVECALAFFDKVVDIWYKYLSALHASATNPEGQRSQGKSANIEHLSEESLADGHGQLEQVLDTRRRLLGIVHIATGEAQFTLGLFELYLMGNITAASAYISSAQRSYESQLGSDHPSAVHVTSCLDMLSAKNLSSR